MKSLREANTADTPFVYRRQNSNASAHDCGAAVFRAGTRDPRQPPALPHPKSKPTKNRAIWSRHMPGQVRRALFSGYRTFANSARRAGAGFDAICARHPGVVASGGGRFAVFVTFNAGTTVPAYVLHHLDALARAGFDVVVVSNNRDIGPNSLRRLQEKAHVVLTRLNMGYDFGAYRDGITYVLDNHPAAHEILLVNDSVFGPFNDLSPLLDRADRMEADVVGLIDSHEVRYHFQSFWLLFRNGALQSEAFRRFWRRMPYAKDKHEVINRYETGLVEAFHKMDLSCDCLFSSRDLMRRAVGFLETKQRGLLDNLGRDCPSLEELLGFESYSKLLLKRHNEELMRMCLSGRPLNPTAYLWEPLISECGFPFLKREVLVNNPGNAPLLAQLEEVVAETGYPADLIDTYLRGNR